MNRILTLITTALLVIVITFHLSAQESFERLYPTTNSDIITHDMVASGTGYGTIGVEIDQDGNRTNINFTTFNSKGNENTSRAIYFDSLPGIYIEEVGNIIRLESGLFAFCANIKKDSLNKMIFAFDGNGNRIWQTRTGTTEDRLTDTRYAPVVVEAENGHIFHITNVNDGARGSDLLLTTLDPERGTVLGQDRLSFSTSSDVAVTERILKMQNGIDGQIMVLSTTDRREDGLQLTKMDTLGNVLWSRSYSIEEGQDLSDAGHDLIQLLDTSWVIMASVLPTTTDRHEGLLLQVDNDGTPLLSQHIKPISARYQIYPNGVVGTLDTTIIFSAMRHDMITDVYESMIISYNLDSVFGYQTVLDTVVSSDAQLAALVTVDSISATLYSTTQPGQYQHPNLSKVDESGLTMCAVKEATVRQDTAIVSMTMMHSMSDSLEVYLDTIFVEPLSFDGFTQPILSLQDTIYCPADPINYFVDASVEGATSYLWNDGNRDSTRTFTEEGQFNVVVIVEENICYTLCDTLTISVAGTPEVMINKNLSSVCTQDQIILLAEASGSQITDYLWDDGSTNSSLIVPDQPGNYSVMVTDACGEMASASVSVTEDDLPQTSGNITLGCEGLLSVGGTFRSVRWDDGSKDETRTVTDAGTYQVTLIDDCGDDSQMLSIDISSDDLPTNDLGGSISAAFPCGINEAELTITGSYNSLEWSTGATSQSITVTAPGTYTATLTGDTYLNGQCMDQLILPLTVSEDDLNNEGCLVWPNALQPEGGDVDNQRFLPRIKSSCDRSSIQNYELKIFNRWGKNLFTSTDVEVGWNGASGSDLQPGGVYYYWARYDNGESVCERRGDVTLVR